jgi:hypothetical protein
MPYKHPTDRQAWHRRHYQDHKEAIKQAAAEWYEDHKDDPALLDRKRIYMVVWRRRKKNGA